MFVRKFFCKLGIAVTHRLHDALVLLHSRRTPRPVRERLLSLLLHWKMIKDELILPYVDLKTEYYDLGLEYRNETNDQVTVDQNYESALSSLFRPPL